MRGSPHIPLPDPRLCSVQVPLLQAGCSSVVARLAALSAPLWKQERLKRKLISEPSRSSRFLHSWQRVKKKEKKKRASEQRRWWCEQRWGMFSLRCVRVRPGRGLTSGCYGPWRMLGWLVKHLCLSKSLHPENSLSLCTPPGSGISPISPEKCVFFFLLFRVRAARKDESVQRRSAGKRESWAATEHTQSPAHFTAELPAAL